VNDDSNTRELDDLSSPTPKFLTPSDYVNAYSKDEEHSSEIPTPQQKDSDFFRRSMSGHINKKLTMLKNDLVRYKGRKENQNSLNSTSIKSISTKSETLNKRSLSLTSSKFKTSGTLASMSDVMKIVDSKDVQEMRLNK